MNSWGRIEGNYAYFWYQKNYIMPIMNCINVYTDNKIKEQKEKDIFIKQYDKNGKIVLPIWETSGKNFDIKK